jgi:hypothetical protein
LRLDSLFGSTFVELERKKRIGEEKSKIKKRRERKRKMKKRD